MKFILKAAVCVVLVLVTGVGCSTIVLQPADFSWPIESVLKVNEKGMIQDQRHSFTLNVKELFFAELQDSLSFPVPVRIIRNGEGYYFLTAQRFKNVYVLEQVEGGMKVVNTISIKQSGLESPALNQRPPYIQLINENDAPRMLTKNGIVEGVQR